MNLSRENYVSVGNEREGGAGEKGVEGGGGGGGGFQKQARSYGP